MKMTHAFVFCGLLVLSIPVYADSFATDSVTIEENEKHRAVKDTRESLNAETRLAANSESENRKSWSDLWE